jgi:hypothetical protein
VGNIVVDHALDKKLPTLVIEIVEMLFKDDVEWVPFPNAEHIALGGGSFLSTSAKNHIP